LRYNGTGGYRFGPNGHGAGSQAAIDAVHTSPICKLPIKISPMPGRGITVSELILAFSSDLGAGVDNCRKAARLVMHRRKL